jgi:hypothetical protein
MRANPQFPQEPSKNPIQTTQGFGFIRLYSDRVRHGGVAWGYRYRSRNTLRPLCSLV